MPDTESLRLFLPLAEIAPREFTLSGTPADCVLRCPHRDLEDIDWVLSHQPRAPWL